MSKQSLIEDLIRATIWRAVREILAAVVVFIFFAISMWRLEMRLSQLLGCWVILAWSVSVTAVIWKFTLQHRMLRIHPATETAFWNNVFMSQSRLLRLVPLWYLAPFGLGAMLFYIPSTSGHVSDFIVHLLPMLALFAAIAWLNRWAAMKIEDQARQIMS